MPPTRSKQRAEKEKEGRIRRSGNNGRSGSFALKGKSRQASRRKGRTTTSVLGQVMADEEARRLEEGHGGGMVTQKIR